MNCWENRQGVQKKPNSLKCCCGAMPQTKTHTTLNQVCKNRCNAHTHGRVHIFMLKCGYSLFATYHYTTAATAKYDCVCCCYIKVQYTPVMWWWVSITSNSIGFTFRACAFLYLYYLYRKVWKLICCFEMVYFDLMNKKRVTNEYKCIKYSMEFWVYVKEPLHIWLSISLSLYVCYRTFNPILS